MSQPVIWQGEGRLIHSRWIWFGFWMIAGVGLFVLAHLDAGTWVIDDAEITYSYARGLVRGNGFGVSAEGPRVEGFSNPLMLLVSTAAAAASLLDPFVFHVVLEALEFGLLLFLVWSILGAIVRGYVLGRVLLTLVFASLELLTPATSIWYGSGLENLQVTLAIAFLVFRFNAITERPCAPLDALAIIIAALVRPEGILYGISASMGALAHAWIACDATRRRRLLRASAVAWSLAGTVLAIGLVLRWSIFASLLPNTYWAKVGRSAPAVSGENYLRELLTYAGAGVFAAVGLLVPVSRPARGTKIMLLCLVPTALALPVVGGRDWMGEHRFGTAYLATVHLLFVVVLAGARAPAWLSRRSRLRAAVATAVPLLAVAAVGTMHRRVSNFYGKQRATIDNVMDLQGLVRVDVQRHLGLFEPVVALGDAGGSRLVGKMQLVDTLALTDFHVPHVRADPQLLHRYQMGERSIDIAVWHGAGALPAQAFGSELVSIAAFPESPRTFWVRRDILTLDALPASAVLLGQMGGVRIWASPATIWQVAPGAYARIELILQLDPDAHAGEHPGRGLITARLEDAHEPDMENLPILGATAGSETSLELRPGAYCRQSFLLRGPRGFGRYRVTLVGGLPGPPLSIGEIEVIDPNSLTAEHVERILGGSAVTLVERAGRLAQLQEQLQPRRPRAEVAGDLAKLRRLAIERRWDMLAVRDRLWADFAAPPPIPPWLAPWAEALKDSAAVEVERSLGIARDQQPGAEVRIADALLTAGRLVDQLRRRRVTGVLDPSASRRGLRTALRAARDRVVSFQDLGQRYRALVGLTLLDPGDMHLQRALLVARPYAPRALPPPS